MPKAIRDGKLQSNLDANNFAIVNLTGGFSGSGSFAVANNLSEGIAATIRTNIGLPASVAGQAVLAAPAGGLTSFLQMSSGSIVSYRSLAQTLSDIGAQPLNPNLTEYATVDPSTAGKAMIAASTPGGLSYLQITSGGTVAYQSASQVAGDVLNGLTINASTGSFQTDGVVTMGDFSSAGTTTEFNGDVLINVPLFTVAGSSLLVLNVTGATDIILPTTGILATRTGVEIITNKAVSASTISGCTLVATTGGLGIRSTGSANDLRLKSAEVMTGFRDLTFAVNNANRTVTFSGDFTTAGAFNTTLTATATTNITLPTTGTLATLTGLEGLSQKTIISPVISTGLAATGSASNDFSASTGTFKTSTGLSTISGGLALLTDTLSGGGVITAVTATTKITTTGAAQAFVLSNGTDGQIKTIIHDVDGGSAVLTPATKTGYTTITFTSVGETATLQFVTTRGWMILSLRGAVAA